MSRACLLCALCVSSLVTACTNDQTVRAEVIKTTPEKPSAAPAAPPPPHDTFEMASYPGGTALTSSSATCKVTMLGRGRAERWEYSVGDCGGILFVAVAPNSVAFARSATELVAFAPDGKRPWAASVGRDPAGLARPAVTLDSLVVTVTSPSTVVAYKADGGQAWSFKVEGEEQIVTSPTRSEAEGALIVTNAAVYTIAS